MNHKRVSSSCIESVAYDEGDEYLEITFVKGTTYGYRGIPKDVYEGLMGAKSHGQYFLREIKPKYDGHKV